MGEGFKWKYRHTAVAALFIVWLVSYMDRMVMATAIPYIAKEFGLTPVAEKAAGKLSSPANFVPYCELNGSEDITVFMDRVQKKGGKALFALFGTPVGGGHHNSRFDIDEKVIFNAADFFLALHSEIDDK